MRRGPRWWFGKTRFQTFLDAMPMTQEKMIAFPFERSAGATTGLDHT
jgi:hypothetical protein